MSEKALIVIITVAPGSLLGFNDAVNDFESSKTTWFH